MKVSPIKFDKFGSVCRYVNQRGSVSHKDTEVFGCEIVRDIPDYIRDFVKRIGLGEVIRVTHFILMFPFLLNNERFQGLFPLKSPTNFVPSVEIMVP